MLLFLRIAVPSGLVFGLISGFVEHSARRGLIQGAVFGALMGLVLAATTAARTQGRTPELSTRHRMDVHLAQTPADAIDEIAAILARFGARNVVRGADRVTGRTGVSWLGWGERVEVRVRPDHDASIASIVSRSWIRTTVTDYGRDRDNVERIAVLLGGFPTAAESA
jgi:hypothetical protein